MHGLINRSIQCFLRDTYGDEVWGKVVQIAGLGFDNFEAMLTYEPQWTEAVILGAMAVLGRPREVLLEDMGTYLVSHPNLEALRRLLRFGGVNFSDFLDSLEDLPERGRLALPDIDLPSLSLKDQGGGVFELASSIMIPGVGHVIVGLLRAMADDYGALVLLDHAGQVGDAEVISIQLLDQSYSEGKSFDLAMRMTAA
jgi:hypothetical protein